VEPTSHTRKSSTNPPLRCTERAMLDIFEAFRFKRPGAQTASDSSKPERPTVPTTARGAAPCVSAQPAASSAKRRDGPRAIEYEEPRRGDAAASTTGPNAPPPPPPPPPPTRPCFRAGVSTALRTSAALWRVAASQQRRRNAPSGWNPLQPWRVLRLWLRVEICSRWAWRRRGAAAGAGAVPPVQEASGE
jgi:hypothetical protein